MVGEPGIGASNVAIPRAPLSHPTRAPLPPHDELAGPSPAPGIPPPVAHTNGVARAMACCDALLSARGDVSGAKLAAEALAAYRSLAAPETGAFFDRLATDCSFDPAGLRRSADEYCADPSPATLLRLQRAGSTPRLELFGRLNLAPGGTAALVGMRARLLRGLAEHPAWAAIEAELGQLLRSWFNHGFLVCRRIDAQTAPEILEKLVQYEAVHKIRDRRDLLRRLESDRRCYGLFHPALPDDPVIFTELSLTRAMGAKVQPLLDADAPVVDAASCAVALFYSISNCHEGLRGFSFGNSLIRLVVEELRRELPRLKSFATLSPIPGFRSWLAGLDSGDGDGTHPALGDLLIALDSPDWRDDRAQRAQLERELVPLCAHYLLRVKQGTEPADPVARFHLANGARLERINWLGDTSEAGLRRSAGMTVNYVYALGELERNHEAYTTQGRVSAARRICTMAARRNRVIG